MLSVFLCLCACTASYEEQEKTPIAWKPIYNDHQICGLQANRALPEGTTKRELTDREIASIVPASLLSQMETTGYVFFLADESLYYMSLQMKQGEHTASVLLGNDISWGGCCLSVAQEWYAEETCNCGDVTYALFQRTKVPSSEMLLGHGRINDVPILVRMHSDDLAEIQPAFENILETFARYKASDLSFASIKPS